MRSELADLAHIFYKLYKFRWESCCIIGKCDFFIRQLALLRNAGYFNNSEADLILKNYEQKIHYFRISKFPSRQPFFHVHFLTSVGVICATLRIGGACIAANYYSLRGEHDRAVAFLQRSLKLNPNNASVWTLIGHEFMEQKNNSAACLAYRKAVGK